MQLTVPDMMNTPEAPTVAWPLIFKYHAPILGNGYIALVELQGRLLARPEADGQIWLDGVNPGALALGAPSLKTANLELHSALTAVFVDIAETSPAFDEFKQAASKFFYDCDEDTVAEWKSCVEKIQSGEVAGPDGLPVYSALTPATITVTLKSVEDLTPGDNPAPGPLLAKAA